MLSQTVGDTSMIFFSLASWALLLLLNPVATEAFRLHPNARAIHCCCHRLHSHRDRPMSGVELNPKTRKMIGETRKIAGGMATRESFLASMGSFTLLLTDAKRTQAMDSPNEERKALQARILSLPLRSLPLSGCWAASFTLSKDLENDDSYFTYFAVVDTGSPFLTAPQGALPYTDSITRTKRRRKSFFFSKTENDETTYEQYGTTVGSVEWRSVPYLTLIGNGRTDSVQDLVTNHSYLSSSLSSSSTSSLSSPDGMMCPSRHDSLGMKSTVDIEPIIVRDEVNVVVGIPSERVIAETGGIFMGLMTVDATHPTPLEQLGYDAFQMRFGNDESQDPPSLSLWDGRQQQSVDDADYSFSKASGANLIHRCDPHSMKVFDLTPYGPNLHHYGVLCERFECRWNEHERLTFHCQSDAMICSSKTMNALSRPLIAVFDTGLSGCIFSDTLWDEIQTIRDREQGDGEGRKDETEQTWNEIMMEPSGCTVWLPNLCRSSTPSSAASKLPLEDGADTTKLSSLSSYWRFQSFRLPWWYDNASRNDNSKRKNEPFPHVVVLGSTFWRHPNILELAIDTRTQRAKIRTLEG